MRARISEMTNQIIFLVAVVGILALVYGIFDRYHPRLDLTKGKIYSLAPQTKKILKGLKQEITIKAFVRGGSPEAMRLEDVLKEYRAQSKYIKYKIVDIDRERLIAMQEGIRKLNTVVFVAGDRRKDVQPENVFGFSMGGEQEFKGEQEFTSAIIELTEGRKKKICFVTGHGEKSLDSQDEEGVTFFKEGLEKENYEVLAFPLAQKKEIRGECDALVILGPSRPYLQEEVKLIEKYVQGGGRMLVALDPIKGQSFPFLSKYGITPLAGKLVLDPVNSVALRGPASIVPQIGTHPAVKVLEQLRAGVYFFEAMPLETKSSGGSVPEALFKTSNKAYTKDVLGKKSVSIAYNPRTDKKGEFTVGAALEKGKTRLVVLGDSDFLTNGFVTDLGQLNAHADVGINMVNWLVEEERKISIRPKKEEVPVLTLEKNQLRWIAWTTLIFTPLSFLIVSGWLFFRRRSL